MWASPTRAMISIIAPVQKTDWRVMKSMCLLSGPFEPVEEAEGGENEDEIERHHEVTLSLQVEVCTRKGLGQRMTQLSRMLIALAPAMALKRPSEAPSVMALCQATAPLR